MDSGKIVASLPTAADMDDMFYDSGRKRIYVPVRGIPERGAAG